MTTSNTPHPPADSEGEQRHLQSTAVRKVLRLPARAATALRFTASVVLAVATLAGLGFAGFRVTTSQGELPVSASAPASPAAAQSPPPGDLVVAVVLGSSQTVATDAMGPFEVFGRSSRFTVYTVAEQPGPARVVGAPAILPDHTFAEVDSKAELAPDVVVVPAVSEPTGETERAMREWIGHQHERGAHVLSVCAGAMVVAETGILEGRTATSHWSRLASLRKRHPETTWVAGQRFVRDGDITSTAGVTSAIPGALSVIHDLAGVSEARRIGERVGYPGWTPEGPTDIPAQSLSLADRPFVINSLLPWLRPTVAIELHDGDTEIDIASLFEVYTNSSAARTIAISPTGVVTTAHGLTLLTLTAAEAPDADSTLRPGVTGPSGRAGFDGALEHLASTDGQATVRAAAKLIDFPTEDLQLGTASGPRRTLALGAAALAVAALAGMVPFIRRRRTKRS
ncbi:MAG: DJ-1/PfpI family protein [Nocardioidaceae bacterium]